MARAGLGPGWSCTYANDMSPLKAAVYQANWGHAVDVRDVALVGPDDIPDTADLTWASFPCQDLSAAGKAAGMGAANDSERTRSGAFWAFMDIMERLGERGRAPACIVLENVYGFLHANGCRDFAAVGASLSRAGYVFGAVLVDAALFLPQSRPRIFLLAVRCDLAIPPWTWSPVALKPWHPAMMRRAVDMLSPEAGRDWVWWDPGDVLEPATGLEEVVDVDDPTAPWHTGDDVDRMLGRMSAVNMAKVVAARASGVRRIGTVFLRRRPEPGGPALRAEVRFDGVLGCVRTARGGSSRQRILVVEGGSVRSRLLTAREAARAMGLPGGYALPGNGYEALQVLGDGVAVPAVSVPSGPVDSPHRGGERLAIGPGCRVSATLRSTHATGGTHPSP